MRAPYTGERPRSPVFQRSEPAFGAFRVGRRMYGHPRGACVQKVRILGLGRHEIVFRQACTCVLALWKLRVGVEDYYLAQVASGLDEYYTGTGEAPGSWMGGGVVGLALTGEVTPADLRAVLAGLAPSTGLTPNGTPLTAHRRRVPGFDLTFSVPKSVSVLFALGDPLVQHAVVAGCDAALVEALGWLEREACFVRRGTNKAENKAAWGEQWGTRRMVANGFVAASFRHRTSRAGDPHLHWHVLVTNLAQGIDGRWSALDGSALYSAKRTVGVMFQVAMRRELSARLGVEWGPMRQDSADIAGIPARVLREFSQRSAQIAEWLETAGLSGPAATDAAILATRGRKQVPADFAAVEAAWHVRADALGWGPTELEQLLAAVTVEPRPAGYVVEDVTWRAGTQSRRSRMVGFEEWLTWLLDTRVTAHDGAFTRFDLIQAVAATLPASTSIEIVEATAQRALASPAIVPVGDHWQDRTVVHAPCRLIPDDRAVRYTSRSLLATEEQLLAQLVGGVDAGVGVLDPVAVEPAIAGSTLGADQAAVIRVLTAAGDRVAVMVGRAGTGKTHTLGTLRTVYEASGYTVIGLAPSARAARELHDGSGIVSTTIARHLVERREIDASTLVVVDEAGMGGVRDLAAVIDQVTRVGAKLVLVGDHRQLPEVSAGGGFRAALDTLDTRVVELTVNRRQQHEWERGALDQLRHGDVATAFAAYQDHERVVLADDPHQLHTQAISDWQKLRRTGDTLMLAGTRAEANLLNREARQILAAAGELDLDGEFEIGGRLFAPGDRIVLCRNSLGQHLANGYDFAVDNGMLATVTGLDHAGFHVRLATGEQVIVDRGYVEQGWVDHAYALTIHKAQGVTCDHVLVVGPAGLFREGIYVALSRARLSAWIYATHAQAFELDQRHDTGIPLPAEHTDDLGHDLLARMHTSGAKSLVTISDPDASRVAELATNIAAHELLQRAKDACEAEQMVGVVDPGELRAAYDRAVATRTHLDEGRRVRALDRDNVGHVLTIDDTAGTCVVHFDNDRGHSAHKIMSWDQLVVIDHPDVVVTSAATAALAVLADAVADAVQDWEFELSAYGIEPGDADLYRRALHVAVDRATHLLRADQPDWLNTWLGPRPADPPGAAVWDDATTRIAHHRLLHNVDDTEPGLGSRPGDADADAATQWQRLMLRILEDRCWLTNRHKAPVEPLTVRSAGELIERRTELERLTATAPADQRDLIERISHADIDPGDLLPRLLDATRVQDARRAWIIANWPHIVELEQISTLIAAQPALAHWPQAQTDPVSDVLDQLRLFAPDLDRREERTLAELDRQAAEMDPVRRLEARRDQLQRLAHQTVSSADQEALHQELVTLGAELRQARRERAVEQVFDRYLPNPIDDARATRITTRITTLAHDVLTTPPAWLIDHVLDLRDNHQLTSVDHVELATRIIQVAAHLELHGQLPATWPAPTPPAVELPQSCIELGY